MPELGFILDSPGIQPLVVAIRNASEVVLGRMLRQDISTGVHVDKLSIMRQKTMIHDKQV
jgi:hypothetical protein